MRLMGSSVGLLLAVFGSPVVVAAAPQAYPPALAVFHSQDYSADNDGHDVLASINGTGFGAQPLDGTFRRADCGLPEGGRFVIIRRNQTVVQVSGSTNTNRVHSWEDGQIVLKLGTATANNQNLNIEVCTENGTTGPATVAKYTYVHHPVPATYGVSAHPLEIVRDGAGTTWVNEEFHLQLKRLSSAGQWAPSSPIPQVAGDGIFAWLTDEYGDLQKRFAALGEDIIVDTLGRVWFSESGSAPYDGVHQNHSRIVMFDPGTQQFQAYNVPGDNNGVYGLAWDATWQRIWFTQGRRSIRDANGVEHVAQRARITSFLPAYTPHDNFFAFTPVETCNVPDGQYVGTCSTHTFRSCITGRDCVGVERICPPGNIYDYWCFHGSVPAPFTWGSADRTRDMTTRNAVCVCADKNMLIPALFVADAARSRCTGVGHSYEVMLFTGPSDVTDTHRQWLEGRGIRLCELDSSSLGDIRVQQRRLTAATLMRLLLPEQLAGRYDKLLYLDSDVTIHDEIAPLFALDTGPFALAATPAGRISAGLTEAQMKARDAHFQALGMTKPYRYINSGVLFIDINKWNRDDVSARALSFARRNADLCVLPDEDAGAAHEVVAVSSR